MSESYTVQNYVDDLQATVAAAESDGEFEQGPASGVEAGRE